MENFYHITVYTIKMVFQKLKKLQKYLKLKTLYEFTRIGIVKSEINKLEAGTVENIQTKQRQKK